MAQIPQNLKPSTATTPPRSTTPAPLERTWKYQVPREQALSWFLGISVALFSAVVFLTFLLPTKAVEPPLIEVDLEGVENEPPPLGEPDAGAGAEQPQQEQPVVEEPP